MSEMPMIVGLNVPHLEQYLGVWLLEESRMMALVEMVRGMDLRAHVEEARARRSSLTISAMEDDHEESEEERQERLKEQRAVFLSSLGLRMDAQVKGGYGIYNYAVQDGVGVVELSGLMTKYGSSLGGGTSTVQLRRTLQTMGRDGDVKAVGIKVESGGGAAAGTMELANQVSSLAKIKPVHAYIEDVGASAAYWTAVASDKIFANSAAVVGSIGTLSVMYDWSQLFAREGIRPVVIKTGEFKATGVQGTEITDAQRAYMQQTVNDINAFFQAGVTAGRKLSGEALARVSDGRIHVSQRAMEMGLIDGIKTMEQFVADLTAIANGKQGTNRTKGMQAGSGQLAVGSEANEGEMQRRDASATDEGINADGDPAAVSIQQEKETVIMAEDNKPVAAGYDQIVTACKGADEKFICAQLAKKASVEQAREAWVDELTARNKALEEKAEQATKLAAVGGLKPVNAGKAKKDNADADADADGDGDAVSQFSAAVSKKVAAGMERIAAVQAVAAANPALHKAFLLATNPRRGAQARIEGKFDE